MAKFVSMICAALMLTLGVARAAEQNASYVPGVRDAQFTTVAAKPCCYNDGDVFQTSPSTCRKYGGRVVSFDYCQRAYQRGPWQNGYGYNNDGYRYSNKPCCYNDGYFFHSTAKTCHRFGGRVVAFERCTRQYNQWNGYGPNDGYYNDGYGAGSGKPCCYNNGRYYQTSPSTCRKTGGYTVDFNYCARGRW
jgi:hypothetical protein